LLLDYITGKITHVVIGGYSPKLLTWEQFGKSDDYDGKLRLISIFGNDKGDLQYCVGQYSDYSGSKTAMFPFTNYEDAKAKLIELLLEKTPCIEYIKALAEFEAKYPQDKLDKFKNDQIQAYFKNIESHNKQIQNWATQITEIEHL